MHCLVFFWTPNLQGFFPDCIQGTAARPAAMAAAKSASSMLMPRLPPAFRATRAAAWISGALRVSQWSDVRNPPFVLPGENE